MLIDRTYVLAALIVLAVAILLALIGIAIVRRFRASRWAEYDISLTDRLERALGTGLPPLKVEPRAPVASVETISTAVIEAPSVVAEAPTAAVDVPPAAPAAPIPLALPVPPVRPRVSATPTPHVPPVPQPDLTPAAGEVWFTPDGTAAAAYELTAPVELRFEGDSGVVGIRADTETAAAFRRMADELTEGIDNDEG